MSCTIEKALADAKALVERLRDHDDAAESLIEQTTALNKRVEAMKQELQAHVDQITEMAAVMRKAIEIDEQQGCKEQERIFQLEQENKGLREILQITRESFLNLRKDDASESTSLSALVTSSDLSLRKS
ncbi:FGFR1 oncogene partner 2 [Tupaia chinensis]|uniref:FGFR1 oncogene partner 2 n=1 Tax=Tupaia chinensis TaxID=246437 RepID=L9LC84_TUPCH|nr:FGFR1 oncogene partner 2 [Tupaia chinensis]